MRKLCFVLTALLLTAPAFAGVEISCAQVPDTCEVEVSYVASDDANRPRAFGLNITLDNGKTIEDIVSGSESEDYWVYPGTIIIDAGTITDLGTPIAPGTDPGALGGKGTGGMTIEMGSLYNDPCDPEHPDPPANDGDLFSFTINIGPGEDCNVTIAGNSARGNVVLEDTEPAGEVTYGTCYVSIPSEDCFPSDHPAFNEWKNVVGEPNSWCIERQCHGDTDGLKFQVGKPFVYVNYVDLDTFVLGFGTDYSGDPAVDGPDDDDIGDHWISADFDHILNQVGKPWFRVGYPDLDILVEFFGKDPDPNCLTEY